MDAVGFKLGEFGFRGDMHWMFKKYNVCILFLDALRLAGWERQDENPSLSSRTISQKLYELEQLKNENQLPDTLDGEAGELNLAALPELHAVEFAFFSIRRNSQW